MGPAPLDDDGEVWHCPVLDVYATEGEMLTIYRELGGRECSAWGPHCSCKRVAFERAGEGSAGEGSAG